MKYIYKYLITHFTLLTLLIFFASSSIFPQSISSSIINTKQINLKVRTENPQFKDLLKGNFKQRDYYYYTDYSKPGEFKLPYQNLNHCVASKF